MGQSLRCRHDRADRLLIRLSCQENCDALLMLGTDFPPASSGISHGSQSSVLRARCAWHARRGALGTFPRAAPLPLASLAQLLYAGRAMA